MSKGKITNFIAPIFYKNIWNIFAVTGSRFSNFLLIIVLSSIFSIESFAIYSIFVGVSAFMIPLTSLGITNYLKVVYANDSTDRYYLWKICLKYILFSIPPTLIIIFLLVKIDPFTLQSNLSYYYLLPIVFIGVASSIINSFDILFNNHISRFIYLSVAAFIGMLVIVSINSIALIDVFNSMLLLAICTVSMLVITKINEFRSPTKTFTDKPFWQHLQESRKYLFHGVAILILSSSDRVMLGLFSTSYQTASYTVIAQFGMAISAVSIIAEAGYLNLVLKTKLRDDRSSIIMDIINNSMPLIYSLGSLVFAFLFINFVDSKYHDVIYLLFPIVGAYFVFYLYGVLINILLANNVAKKIQFITGFWSLLNVVLNIFLLEKFGAMGATLTTVLCFYGMTFNLAYTAKSKGCNISSLYNCLLIALFNLPILIYICLYGVSLEILSIFILPIMYSSLKAYKKFKIWKEKYG